jgi:hypothetical protein
MYQFITWIVAAAEGCKKALVDQVFQTGTSFSRIAITRGAAAIGSSGNLAPIREDFYDALLVLLEARAAVAADELFLNEDSDGFRPPGKAALVEGLDDGFYIGIAFAKGYLCDGPFGSAACLGEAALIQLPA